MKLEGLHHVTCITGDARRNVDFYTRVMGQRLVKKTVNQDDPGVYHLFYGDDTGAPGHDLTFFEYPGAAPGTAGEGMVHTVAFRVASVDALGFWEQRLRGEGITATRADDGGIPTLRFADPEGLGLELRVEDVPDLPLVPTAPDIPHDVGLRGFAGVRAYAARTEGSMALLQRVLGFTERSDGAGGPSATALESRGDQRGGWIAYEPTPAGAEGQPGAGTVHHVAWAIPLDTEDEWNRQVRAAGAQTSGVVDRFYFRSVYFNEPSGVLFELATMGPGFAVDEDADKLGETVALPPFLEPLRARIEEALTPLGGVGRHGSASAST